MNRTKAFMVATLAIAVVFGASGTPVTIRLGYNNMPPNSPWSQGLERLAAEWKEATGGEVVMQIKHAQGDEKIILQKMNSGFLEACVFDGWGMRSIADETFVMSIPSLIRTDEELKYVMEKVTPYLMERVEARKDPSLKALGFMQVGWIRFFSRNPILNPEDLMKQKLSLNANQTDIHQLWIALGFNINTSPGMLVQQLSSKMVDAFFTSPLWVASQWKSIQSHTPYMTEMKLAPVLAGIFVKTEVWARISPENQRKMIAVTKEITAEMEAETGKEELKVIAQLEAKGLKVVKSTPESVARWEENFRSGIARGASKAFSQVMFEKVKSLTEKIRKRK